jgi:hypothetical protein
VTLAPWTDPATIAEAHAWLRESIRRKITGPIEQPHIRPWSTVFRAPTEDGDVYLKLCGRSQAHEPALTVLLAGTAAALVPEVLAVHPREPWLLLADGGAKLRDVLSGPALLDAWVDLLPRYAELQRSLLGREATIRATGTPDRPLDRLVGDLRAILADDRVLAAAAFGAADRDRLQGILPRIDARARDLASLDIGPTVQHDDLHDANVLRRGQRTVVFDWGDASLTHPFLSLGVVLEHAARRAALDPSDAAIVRLRDAYLEPWTAGRARPLLEEAADIGARLSTITQSLSWHRVVTLNAGALEAEPATMGRYLAMVAAAFDRDG